MNAMKKSTAGFFTYRQARENRSNACQLECRVRGVHPLLLGDHDVAVEVGHALLEFGENPRIWAARVTHLCWRVNLLNGCPVTQPCSRCAYFLTLKRPCQLNVSLDRRCSRCLTKRLRF